MANMKYYFAGSDDITGTAKYNAVSFGAGVKVVGVNGDYAADYRSAGDGDWSLMITASVPFSLCK